MNYLKITSFLICAFIFTSFLNFVVNIILFSCLALSFFNPIDKLVMNVVMVLRVQYSAVV